MRKKFLNAAFLLMIPAVLSGCGGTSTSEPDNSDSGPISSVSGNDSSADEEDYEDCVWDGKVKIYYHNDTSDYASKRIWAWASGVDGVEYAFDNQTNYSSDDFGLYKVFDMGAAPWKGNVTISISFIIKNVGSWSGQSTDTVCHFGKFASKAIDDGGSKMIVIYACDGEGGTIDTFTEKTGALGDRIASASFSSWTSIAVTGGGTSGDRAAADVGKVASYELYAYDSAYYQLEAEDQALAEPDYLLLTGTANSNSFSIALSEVAKPYYSYTLKARMALDTSKVKAKVVSFTKLFDDADFIKNYTYSGSDLGCTANHQSAVFKVWAPTSSRVQVKIYTLGTPADLIDPFDPSRNWGRPYDMKIGKQGVWQLEIADDLLDTESPYYYTYIVTNSNGTNEVCDPYAKTTGINGRRAAIIDLDQIASPEGWDRVDSYSSGDSLLPTVTSPNELSVYECHIRDLTSDSSWSSNKGNRNGTYGAFAEAGTTYSKNGLTVKTGRDNIDELKFDAIQLLPVFDQDNDEFWRDADGNSVTIKNPEDAVTPPSYNWGYNPLNYNVVEGAYCSNPFDPFCRMTEFKDLVYEYAKSGTRIIMDVVYNHVSSVSNSSLTKLVPYYYFRTNASGYYTNGSGVGNETATERAMTRKLIVDSCVFWASYYKIKGFRFDVMGVMDGGTLKAISSALYAVDKNIVLYGEGWTADGSYGMSDKSGKRAVMASCYEKLYAGQTDCPIGIGCFNSVGKQALKGEEHLGWGFMNRGNDWANDDAVNRVTYMLNGHVNNGSDLDYANPTQTVNYASCHDNYTNYDAMNYTVGTGPSSAADSTVAMESSVAAMAAVLFSEGIAFTQGGEEIFRQKVMQKDNPYYSTITSDDYVTLDDGSKLVRNSYAYGDDVNSFKWDRKVTYNKYFESFKSACVTRAAVKSDILGRAYDPNSQWGAQGITGWGTAINHGCGIAYQIGSTSNFYYGFLIGRVKADNYGSTGGTTKVSMGTGTYQIVYSSYGRTGSISVGTDGFTAYQNEFLLLKNY